MIKVTLVFTTNADSDAIHDFLTAIKRSHTLNSKVYEEGVVLAIEELKDGRLEIVD